MNQERLLAELRRMYDHLPGLDGIKTAEGHIGNKYVDYGWKAAVVHLEQLLSQEQGGELTAKLRLL